MTWLSPLCFLFELIYDWRRIIKGKTDLFWAWRPVLCLPALVDLQGNLHWSNLLLCVVAYAFFDPLLNLLRRWSGQHWITWDHLGEKKWDETLKKCNKWLLLALRGVVMGLFILTYILCKSTF